MPTATIITPPRPPQLPRRRVTGFGAPSPRVAATVSTSTPAPAREARRFWLRPPLLGRSAVKNTWNLLANGIVKLMRALAGLVDIPVRSWAEGHGYDRYMGSSVKGEATIEWSNQRERRELLRRLLQRKACDFKEPQAQFCLYLWRCLQTFCKHTRRIPTRPQRIPQEFQI